MFVHMYEIVNIQVLEEAGKLMVGRHLGFKPIFYHMEKIIVIITTP